ncbi:MAG: HipA domain-containing protein [Clostridiales bacterium]|nr:HipA domain-containing protein [Clostridiales bacterium]
MAAGIDFTHIYVNKLRMYGGSNGGKISVRYRDENYMLKFPPKLGGAAGLRYSNSCISEHVACRIFTALGIDTQETLLGRYGDKIVVACKDFETDGFVLKDFAHLKNTIIDSSQSGYGTELSDVLDTIHGQQVVPPAELEAFFWKMFIGDALLGNFDRHNGNWGFLINEARKTVRIAPVYDCGSCLYPQLEEDGMERVMANREDISERLFVFPNSALKQNGVKINYARFLSDIKYESCAKALSLVGARIDLRVINVIVDDTPYISETHKTFLKTMIRERKERIIDTALGRGDTQ